MAVSARSAPPFADADLRRLRRLAHSFRFDVVRMTHHAKAGHPGGALSCVDMVTALYFHHMRYDPKNPGWPERDRFVLSKGHGCCAQYAALAGLGVFPKEELLGYRILGRNLQGHPDMTKTPGIEMSTGSLGQGLSAANGMALGLRLDRSPARVYCVVSDAEMQEGQTWEAALTSAHHRLDNLCVLFDHNGLQIDGQVEKIKSIEPIAEKWRAFGWHVIEIDGHDMRQILEALAEASAVKGRPTHIHARTVKGKGVSFMEKAPDGFHGVAPNDEEAARALAELEASWPE
jgi:transketolase